MMIRNLVNIHLRSPRVRQALSLLCLIALLSSSSLTWAQQPKRPITHGDYDSWRTIQGQQLSRDGKFVAYAYQPEDGDGEIVVRNVISGSEWRAPRGYRPPATPPEDGNVAEFQAAQARLVRPIITADSRFVIFSIEPNKFDVRKAKRDQKKPEDMPKNALGIMDLSNGQVTRIDRVKNFQVPEDGSGFIAYLLDAKPEEKKPEARKESQPSSSETTSAPSQTPSAATSSAPSGARKGKEKKKEYGSNLVLRSTTTSTERTFNDVLDYSFSKDAKSLVFAVSSRKDETNGVYVAMPQTDASPVSLISGKGKYQKLTWDEDQTQLAFTSDRDDAEAQQPKFKIYHWSRQGDKAEEIVSTSSPNFGKDSVVSEKASLNFALDGSRLFFGIAPPPEPEKDSDKEPLDDERVLVDLWNWKDDYIQPIQKVRAEQDRNRSYRAVYHFKEKKLVRLADETMENISPSNDGRYAIGADDRAYRRQRDWDAGYTDYYLVNTMDGSRKLLAQKRQGNLSLSPGATYATYFDGKDWHSLSVPGGKDVNLTKNLGVNFWEEDTDTPSTPGSYGNAGWAKDDKYLLIYDRFDIWQVTPDGASAKNLTDGVGRKEHTELRYVRLDPRERSIDPAKPLLLHAENEETRDQGFYRDRIDGGLPEKLVMAARDYSNPTKAKDADVLLLTAARFDQFPDLLVTASNFKNVSKVSDGDKQRSQFIWGTSELVSYKNEDGVPLKGMLIKPGNFDPAKKYPMIVYIYERLSQGLHNFRNPSPGTSINPTFYASNGYLVFMPDIVYTIGYPGQSALKCVLPAVQAVVDKGFVDESAIGIQGHSWGGYQIAYMVTQTNRFKAAAPGAAVSNMTSAYSGIRWGTGLARQFQYERTQSRIGGSLWEYPMRYLENSPVFRADRVQTPLLMINNDEDDAVPWYQGIEYYLALRRLNKEAYLFSYNGEKHGLRKRQNQKDYTRRLQEFFDHFLKGAPAPAWMEKGIPYIQREKEKEQYRIADGPTKQ
jgi:dipeptidyl aminopeptidase/acylaminoacyl peptidase